MKKIKNALARVRGRISDRVTRFMVRYLAKRGLLVAERNTFRYSRELLAEAAESQAIHGPFHGVKQGRIIAARRLLLNQVQIAAAQMDAAVTRAFNIGVAARKDARGPGMGPRQNNPPEARRRS